MGLEADVIVAGGGLAGLTSAIHLSAFGFKVVIVDKDPYPRHKVCGEFVSNEVSSYLDSLGIRFKALSTIPINKLKISTSSKTINFPLPLGGFGISRYSFDYALLQKALQQGCTLIEDTVLKISFSANRFQVSTAANGTLEAGWVLGAYGKRSVLDVNPIQSNPKTQTAWLAVKAHYRGKSPGDEVSLNFFKGGYCGVSAIEDELINVCYIASYSEFKKYRDLKTFQQEVLCQNPMLKQLFDTAQPVFRELAIGQVSFEEKECVSEHVLMIGDSAGLIHPLCGNGMAMAIHAAKMAAEAIIAVQKRKIDLKVRSSAEEQYERAWKRAFWWRLRAGRCFTQVSNMPAVANILLESINRYAGLGPFCARQTHGTLLTGAQ